MTVALASVANVRVPASYKEAVKALERCQNIDEAKEWRDKAEAVAGWARLAKDESALVAAMRFAAHCTRRMGELLAEIPKEAPGPKTGDKSGRPESIPTRTETAERAGLSRHQTTQALAVAAIPEKKFERLVEAEKPPTLTELARIGTKPRALPQDHLRGRDPKDFNVAMHAHGAVVRFVKEVASYDLGAIARGTDPDDRAEKASNARDAIAWLERLLSRLEKNA
jgi:hypothetical protein